MSSMLQLRCVIAACAGDDACTTGCGNLNSDDDDDDELPAEYILGPGAAGAGGGAAWFPPFPDDETAPPPGGDAPRLRRETWRAMLACRDAGLARDVGVRDAREARPSPSPTAARARGRS